VYSEYLTGHAGYLYLRGDAGDDEEPEEAAADASEASAAAAWCAEKSRARDGWEGEAERVLARADGAFFLVAGAAAAAVVVQATAAAMETMGDTDGEVKPLISLVCSKISLVHSF